MSAHSFIVIFVIISVTAAVMDFILAHFARRERTNSAMLLRHTCCWAGAVVLFYSLTVVAGSYLLFSMATSVYFLSITLMLVYFFFFTMDYTGHSLGRKYNAVILLLVLADVIIEITNIFFEISVHYVPKTGYIDTYVYEMKPLYYYHLLLAYTLLAASLSLLVHKLIASPEGYKKQYGIPVAGIAVVALINATFLFMPKGVYNALDYSVICYPIATYFMYWSAFKFKQVRMLDYFRAIAIERAETGIVMFDYQDRLILWNQKADKLTPEVSLVDKLSLEDFKKSYERLEKTTFGDESISVQCGYTKASEVGAVRVDYQPVFSRKNKLLGRIFILSSLDTELDLLTGFQNLDGFSRRVIDNPSILNYPVDIVVIDINKLEQINTSMGDKRGDLEIRRLSELMREHFPDGTDYIRGRDALLAAVYHNTNPDKTDQIISRICDAYSGTFQFGIASADGTDVSVKQAAAQARDNMRIKKLLDIDSNHSAVLSSLVRALEETDSDTEAHVRRTRRMGIFLAERMGLNDTDKTHLALLCLLHDIGKIGIPLEILNKPGRLSVAEWNVLKSHVEKGYQICISTSELECIADMVRYHHERWDGKGYPDGLSATEIPLLSRIISVVDAYDAMVNDRSYRMALPEWEARAELRKCAGTQFDPEIVDAFISLLEEIDSKPVIEVVESSIAKKDDQVLKKPVYKNIDGNTHVIKYSRYVLDDHERIIEADAIFEELTGYSREDIDKGTLSQQDLIPEEDRTFYLQLVSKYIGENGVACFEHRLQKKDGSTISVMCIGRRFYDSATKTTRNEIIVADSSTTWAVRKALGTADSGKTSIMRTKQIEPARDSLTGLLTMEAFLSELKVKLVSSKRKLLVLTIEVNDFDSYCNERGVGEGEDILFKISQVLNASLRQGDIACKMEGGKFAALIEFNPSISEARMKARMLQISERVTLVLTANSTDMTVAVGIAVADRNEDSALSLVAKAEQNTDWMNN